MGSGRLSFFRLPGGRRARPVAGEARPLRLFLHGRADYGHSLIGAAAHGEALRTLAHALTWDGARAVCLARLICRDGSPLERNTLAVEIGGWSVGYAPSTLATQYREWLDQWQFGDALVQCNALVLAAGPAPPGPIAIAAIRLDVELPFKVTTL